MTKMSTPQTSVIRFNESDVIVASGGAAVLITSGLQSEWEIGQLEFGKYSYSTGDIFDNREGFYSDINETFDPVQNRINADTRIYNKDGYGWLGVIIDRDISGNRNGDFDGIFNWNSSLGSFEYQ